MSQFLKMGQYIHLIFTTFLTINIVSFFLGTSEMFCFVWLYKVRYDLTSEFQTIYGQTNIKETIV